MSKKRGRLIWVLLVILVALISSEYYFYLRPLLMERSELEDEIAQVEQTLEQLYALKAQEAQMDAEYLEAQLEMERYQSFVYEYGTYPQLIMLLADMEKRLNVNINSIGLGESSFNISMEATYDTLKDFLNELESIDYLYTCQGLSFQPRSSADTTTLSPSVDNLQYPLADRDTNKRDNMPVSVSLSASFIEQPVKSLDMEQINALIGARVFGKENVFEPWP